MQTKSTVAVLMLLACSAASADEMSNAAIRGADRSHAVMLYLEFPVAARDHKPAFGLRVQRNSSTGLAALAAERSRQDRAVLDLRLNHREERADEETQALSLLGVGKIVAIAVGAAVAVAVISDDDDGGGGY